MVIWHNTGDASRIPESVMSGEEVTVWIGTYPIEPGQVVWVEMKLLKADGRELKGRQHAVWHSNNEQRNNSYWAALIGEFESGDRVQYEVHGKSGVQSVRCPETFSFDVS